MQELRRTPDSFGVAAIGQSRGGLRHRAAAKASPSRAAGLEAGAAPVFQIGQYIREDGPKDHQKKVGHADDGMACDCIAILLPTSPLWLTRATRWYGW